MHILYFLHPRYTPTHIFKFTKTNAKHTTTDYLVMWINGIIRHFVGFCVTVFSIQVASIVGVLIIFWSTGFDWIGAVWLPWLLNKFGRIWVRLFSFQHRIVIRVRHPNMYYTCHVICAITKKYSITLTLATGMMYWYISSFNILWGSFFEYDCMWFNILLT